MKKFLNLFALAVSSVIVSIFNNFNWYPKLTLPDMPIDFVDGWITLNFPIS